MDEFKNNDHEGFSGFESDNDIQSGYFTVNSISPTPPTPPHKNGNGLKVFAVIICVLFILTLISFLGYVLYNSSDLTGTQRKTNSADSEYSLVINETPEEQESQSVDGELTTEAIAQKVMPSVVGIVVYSNTNSRYAASKSFYSGGEGSGIIMSSDGYIITNAHVVTQTNSYTGAVTAVDKVVVYLSEDETYDAAIIGVDTRTDLAVIKIEANNLTPAEFGDSSALKVGEKAIAIGNPTGLTLASSLTQGIISGVNRQIPTGASGYTVACIQTDAAINPGNSGGALVNKYGQVIGINSSKIASTDYEGIGFAIPINFAKDIIDNLMQNGYVADRTRIGITFSSISETLAEFWGIPSGLRVVTVDESTDAYKKGVQAGDIITSIDDTQVITLSDISPILESKRPGDTVKLTIYRITDNEPQYLDIEVVLQEDNTSNIVK